MVISVSLRGIIVCVSRAKSQKLRRISGVPQPFQAFLPDRILGYISAILGHNPRFRVRFGSKVTFFNSKIGTGNNYGPLWQI
jgi:hypothetical protein